MERTVELPPIQPGDVLKMWDLFKRDDWDLARLDHCIRNGLASLVRRDGTQCILFS